MAVAAAIVAVLFFGWRLLQDEDDETNPTAAKQRACAALMNFQEVKR